MVVYKTEKAVELVVTVTFSWLSGHLFTCNLLFTSYNAGATDDVTE